MPLSYTSFRFVNLTTESGIVIDINTVILDCQHCRVCGCVKLTDNTFKYVNSGVETKKPAFEKNFIIERKLI